MQCRKKCCWRSDRCGCLHKRRRKIPQRAKLDRTNKVDGIIDFHYGLNYNIEWNSMDKFERMRFKMYYRMKVAGVERDLPICKVTDELYIGAFVIFGDVELTEKCAADLLKKAPVYDYLLTAEAKGIPLIHEMARQSGQNKYVLARKGPKLYMRDILDVAVHSITTAKEQHLYLDGNDAALIKGKRVLLIDDVISTGESLTALEKLVEAAGGIVCGKMAILAEGDAQDREDILYLEKLPLFNADGSVKE